MRFHSMKRCRGQVLVFFALSLLVLLGLVGLVIDSGRGYGIKAKLSSAADAAAIAGARGLGGDNDAARIAKAEDAALQYFAANFPNSYLGSAPPEAKVEVVHNANGYWQVQVTGQANMPTTLTKLLRFDNVPVAAVAQAIRRDLDMVLVLDTSASLAPPTSPSSTFPTLKSAAINFLTRFNAAPGGDRVGLVSFASGAVVDVPIDKTAARGFNRTSITNAINALSAGGSTASAEGMRVALNELNLVPAGLRSNLRVIVFFSDGAPNTLPAQFTRTSGARVTGDLFSGVSRDYPPYSFSLYRNDRRNTLIGNYGDIARLPNSGFDVTGIGPVPLASYRGLRNLGALPYAASQCNVNKAARNMVENVANMGRDQQILIFTIGLGQQLTTLEIDFCGYALATEKGETILMRLANTAHADTFNATQPAGMYAHAANANELDQAFAAVASELLRLSM